MTRLEKLALALAEIEDRCVWDILAMLKNLNEVKSMITDLEISGQLLRVMKKQALHRAAKRARGPMAAGLLFTLSGCAQLAPISAPIELTHVSHATQHFGAGATNFGYDALSAGLKWTPAKGLSIKLEEGLVLDPTVYYRTKDYGVQAMHGDMFGPREVFSATISYEIPLK